MTATKLSNRAKIILAVIREKTGHDASGNCLYYFVPSAYPVHCEMFPAESIDISGSGDAKIIKSLIERGLAKKRRVAAYAAEITEDGILAYEELRNDPFALADQDRKRAEQQRLDAEDIE